MDKTRVMISMPGPVKVSARKKCLRDYRDARVKHRVVIRVECVSADGMNPMLI
jgi:hypothetical protein